MILWLLLSTSQAEEVLSGPEMWTHLHRARVTAFTEKSPGLAIRKYKDLLTKVPKDDGLYFEILYWLGRTYAQAGDYELARSALKNAAEDVSGRVGSDATSFLFAMNRWEYRAKKIPYNGQPWVDSLGNRPQGASSFFSMAFEPFSGLVTEISVGVDIDEPVILMSTLKDWSGDDIVYQISLDEGQHVVSIPLSALKEPVISLDISGRNDQNRKVPFKIGDLRIE